jgi:hypothetical protein
MGNFIYIVEVGTNQKIAMIVIIASFLIRVILICIKSYFRYYQVTSITILDYTFSREITKNNIIHDRKFALFPGSSRQRFQNEQNFLWQVFLLGVLTKEAHSNSLEMRF